MKDKAWWKKFHDETRANRVIPILASLLFLTSCDTPAGQRLLDFGIQTGKRIVDRQFPAKPAEARK